MSLSEFETRRITKVVGDFVEAHRPPAHIRQQVDLGFRFQNQSVEIFEIRPRFKGAPGEIIEESVAKATFVKARGHWKAFWQRADLKWHPYPPAPIVGSIEEFLALVAEDKHACFFG